MVKRCINIDWLEVYVLEPDILNADFFEADGWIVNRRSYGTRIYAEMFTLLDYTTHEPLLEVRRGVLSSVLDAQSCHIRLCNRTCYYENAAKLLSDFLERYRYIFVRIARIDLCLDFELFDSGDSPQRFVQRYVSGRYSRMFTADLRAVGKDMWDGRQWNSLSWGSYKSKIGTKLYNKTLELKEKKDKPYIRQAWALAGLVDDFQRLVRTDKHGREYSPQIWRLEFSIRSSVKRWFVVDVDMNGNRTKLSKHNTLDCYYTREQLLNVFASLSVHYFHFKHVVEKPKAGIAQNTMKQHIQYLDFERTLQRKDRCPDKILFNWSKKEMNELYQVERVATATPSDVHYNALIRKLEEYRELHPRQEIVNACDLLISDIRQLLLRRSAANPSDSTEIALLQQLLSLRLKAKDKQSITIDDAMAMLTVFDDLTSEMPPNDG